MISFALLQATATTRIPDSLTVRLHSDPTGSLQIWLPALSAIVVLIAGSFIQWRIASRQWKEQRQALDRQLEVQRELTGQQLSAQRETTERQIIASLKSKATLEWIGELRSLVSDFLSRGHDVMEIRNQIIGASSNGQPIFSLLQAERRRVMRLNRQYQRISVHLESDAEKERQLQEAVDAFLHVAVSQPPNKDSFQQMAKELGITRSALLDRTRILVAEHSSTAGSGK
jgi:hypothetical protein